MKSEIIIQLHKNFEDYSHEIDGEEFWFARDLMGLVEGHTGSDTKIDISRDDKTHPLTPSLDRGEVITKAGTLSEGAEDRRLRLWRGRSKRVGSKQSLL